MFCPQSSGTQRGAWYKIFLLVEPRQSTESITKNQKSLSLPSSVVIQRQKRDIRANHKCKPNLARPKTQRFFHFRELKAKFDFVNLQRVNQNSFFLKIQISSLI